MKALLFAAIAAAVGTNEVVQTDACAANAEEVLVASKPKGNPDVEHLLREQGLNYKVDRDGDFELSLETDNGRHQVVHIFSEMCEFDGYEQIHIYSVAYRGKLTKPMLMELLVSKHRIGNWHIAQDGSTIFTAKVAKNITAKDFENCLHAVADWADAKEEEWTDDDEW